MSWERVLTIHDYYDGPRLGIANYRGEPHVYQCRFSEIDDDWTDEFFLTKIEPELLALVMENWEISRRWTTAFKAGHATIETHPALAADRDRHETLKRLIGDRLSAQTEKSIKVKARFRTIDLAEGTAETEWLPSDVGPALRETKSGIL